MVLKNNSNNLYQIANRIRKDIVTMSYQKNKAHISSSLSIVDILVILYWKILKLTTKNITKPHHPIFILSKGHAAPALYAVLYQKQIISKKQFITYGTNGTLLGVHPEAKVSGIEVSTGSLGHGLGIGIGIALSAKMNKIQQKVYILISDGECQEGSIWESMLFAAHHKLDNLYVIVDYNKLQAFGKVAEITNLAPLADKFKSFGWNTFEIDGHNISELLNTFSLSQKNNKPTLYICHTIGGKGISFMENTITWHYENLSKELYKKAMNELENKL